jgi:hypothetical protein
MYTIGTGSLRFKAFETLHEATVFANAQPIDSVIEIKYYDDTSKQKQPDRN